MTEWIAVLAATLGSVAGDVHGTVRSEGTGDPIAGVQVSVVAASETAVTSGEDGAYAIRGLAAGSHRLRFSQFGYHDLVVEALVPDGGELRLDVRLRRRPIAMPAIAVRAGPEVRTDRARTDVGPLAPGSRVLAFSSMGADPLTSEPDALLSLDAVAGIDMAEESPTGLHVRGGSADQNLILLDGVPVYNAYHTSGVFSGVNPDAVSEVALHTGAPPARYGGRLSSVIDIATATPGRAGFAVRGGVGPADLRTTVETLLPGGGGLLIAGRRTTYDLVERGDFDRKASSGFDEMLVKASMPAPGGEFDLLSFHGTNGLSFFADPATMEDDEDGSAGGPGDLDPDHRYSPVRWTTDTDAVIWRGSDGQGTDWRARAWRSGTHSTGTWGTGDGRLRFDHGLEHFGLEAQADRTRPWGALRVGMALERVSTSYATRPDTGDDLRGRGEGAGLASAATSVSAWVDHRWIPHDRWLVDNGLRAVAGAGGGLDLEPRVSVHYRLRPEAALSVGYARGHQYVQSLRNEESVLSAAFGFDPLVSSAHPRVPVGRSDQVTVSARFGIAEGLHLELDGYARWLDGLVLVAPATPQPFAVTEFATGSGTARGVGAALFYRGAKTDVDVVAEWGAATRRTDQVAYRPTFERRRSLAAGAIHRLGPRTSVRGAFRAVAGRSTSALASGFEWEPFDPYTGEIEFGGAGLRRSGDLNRERLPAYVRLDAGIRRTWGVSLPGLRGGLVTWVDVLNVLGRRNVLALQERPDGDGWGRIPLARRSIAAGIQWSF